MAKNYIVEVRETLITTRYVKMRDVDSLEDAKAHARETYSLDRVGEAGDHCIIEVVDVSEDV